MKLRGPRTGITSLPRRVAKHGLRAGGAGVGALVGSTMGVVGIPVGAVVGEEVPGTGGEVVPRGAASLASLFRNRRLRDIHISEPPMRRTIMRYDGYFHSQILD